MINTLLIIIMTIIAYTLIGGLLLIIVRKTACVMEVIRLLTHAVLRTIINRSPPINDRS